MKTLTGSILFITLIAMAACQGQPDVKWTQTTADTPWTRKESPRFISETSGAAIHNKLRERGQQYALEREGRFLNLELPAHSLHSICITP